MVCGVEETQIAVTNNINYGHYQHYRRPAKNNKPFDQYIFEAALLCALLLSLLNGVPGRRQALPLHGALSQL